MGVRSRREFAWSLRAGACLGALAFCALALGQTAGRPMLGIRVGDLPPGAPLHGALVGQVVPNSPASAAGIQANDVIIGVDGRPIAGAAALTAYVGSRRAGDTLQLVVVRAPFGLGAGQPVQLTLSATLGGAPAPAATAPLEAGPPQASGARAGSAIAAPASSGQQPEAAAGPATTQVQWVEYTEPAEQSFTTEVPRGWHVAGSVARRAELGASPYLRLLSPDRRIYIVLGDPSLTLFTTPLRTVGGRPAWRGQVLEEYVASIPFARDFATGTLSKLCGDVSIEAQKDRADLTQGRWAQANPTARHSGGEVSFACRRNGQQMRGVVEVENYIYPSAAPNMGGALWSVDLLLAYFAPPERGSAAAAWMNHVLDKTKLNPAWMRQEQEKEQAVVRGINAATVANSQAAAALEASARRQMHATLQQGEAFDRIINGASPYVDSAGNHYYQLDNTKTQWVGPGGKTIGTSNGLSPGPGWEKLQEVPPE